MCWNAIELERFTRSQFLQSVCAALAASRAALSRGNENQRPRRILLRSSWQTVKIGGIAHTPGVLAILERHLSDVEVRLWPSKVDNGVEEMLLARFIEVLRQTKLKVLICPEDQTQMAVGKELLYDLLPADVKPRAVWRPDYWLTGEALSTYVRSAGLFGNEMHSPILCIGNGIPAIVCRWSEQTTKGLMWRDISLGDWLFDFDQDDDCRRLPETVLSLAKDLDAALAKAAKDRHRNNCR